MQPKSQRVVLAYSGGLDTSVMLHWLKTVYGYDVIAFAADLGQEEELDHLEEKALSTGASKIIIRDLRYEFVKNYVFPAIRARAIYETQYLLGTALARPLIAKEQIRIAQEHGADTVAHGATGKGNDQVRFELSYYALCPNVKVLAPWRFWPFKSRSDLLAYAKKHQIPVQANLEKPYSIDRNVMHVSYEGGTLEDPANEPSPDMFLLTKDPMHASTSPDYVEIEFFQGNPVALDGKKLSPDLLLKTLNILGGKHGVGRVDLVENRFVGIKSRGVYEAPGASILHMAHQALESLVLDREVAHLKAELAIKYARLIYNGFWFAPEFKILQSALDATQETVSGTVVVKLISGQIQIASRKSPFSLYTKALATFEQDDVYRQADAESFIKLQALRLKNYALQAEHKENSH